MKRTIAIIALALPLLLSGDGETIGYLGVSTGGLSEAMKIALEIDYGVIVERIYDDSPAEKAGLEVGDVITEIDKEQISDYRDLKEVVAKRPDERVTVSVYRKGTKLSKMVTLGEREMSKLRLEVDIPEIPDLKVILGTKELQEHIDNLTQEIEQLKEEIEQIKKQLR
ncbi:MAG: PDZ domain-containing protein [bacterium]